MVKAVGGDAVGMSTVPEVIVAKHMEWIVSGFRSLQMLADQTLPSLYSHEEVLEAANKAMPNVIKIVKGLVKNYQ